MRRPEKRLEAHPDEARELAALEAALVGEANEWARCVSEVRAARPELRPTFAARMDAQIARALAPRAKRGKLASSIAPGGINVARWVRKALGASRPRRTFAIAGALASVLVALVTGVSALRSGTEERNVSALSGGATPSGAPSTAAAPARGAPSRTAQSDSARGGASPAPAPFESAIAPRSARPRMVERTTQLALTAPADAVARVADGVVATTDRFGGIVERSDVNADDHGGGSATFELRIPTAELARALAALSKLAHVQSRSQSSLDITASANTVSDRLAAARAERVALLRRLGRANTDNETAAIHARLRTVDGRVADLRGQAAKLAQRANLARVSVTLTSTGKRHAAPGAGHTWGPGDAWRDGLRVLSGAAAVAIVAGVLGVPLALLGALALAAARRSRARRREAALGPA